MSNSPEPEDHAAPEQPPPSGEAAQSPTEFLVEHLSHLTSMFPYDPVPIDLPELTDEDLIRISREVLSSRVPPTDPD